MRYIVFHHKLLTPGAGHVVQTTVTTKHPTSLANSISDQSTSVDSLSMNVGRVANPVTKPGIGESEEVT